VLTGDGRFCVVWSGRPVEGGWGIYLSRGDGETWDEPAVVSAAGSPARAPQICQAEDGTTWIAWHAGVGAEMRIEVLEVPTASAQTWVPD
jgi:hypothetical protein